MKRCDDCNLEYEDSEIFNTPSRLFADDSKLCETCERLHYIRDRRIRSFIMELLEKFIEPAKAYDRVAYKGSTAITSLKTVNST